MFRAIVKKRKAFEYKLRRKVKEKVDFLNYIQVRLILVVFPVSVIHFCEHQFSCCLIIYQLSYCPDDFVKDACSAVVCGVIPPASSFGWTSVAKFSTI